MQTSSLGLQLIRQEEGLVLTVQGDTGGKQEIGYGHDLLPGEEFPDGITQETAETLLLHDVDKWEIALDPMIPPSCTQNQYDALIDFTHECGVEAMHQLLAHGWSQVTVQLPRWIHARVNGSLVVLQAMVARRQKEIELFNTP